MDNCAANRGFQCIKGLFFSLSFDVMDCSFWLEAKQFIFSRRGGNSFCISEKSRKMMLSLTISGGMVVWFSKVVEGCSRTSDKVCSFQTREGSRVFLVQRGQNSYGRFVKVMELGTGMGKGIIVIPEGHKGSGWAGYVTKLNEMIASFPPVSI